MSLDTGSRFNVFVTNRVAVRVLEAGPPPNFIEFRRASFGDGSHQAHPVSWIQDPGFRILYPGTLIDANRTLIDDNITLIDADITLIDADRP